MGAMNNTDSHLRRVHWSTRATLESSIVAALAEDCELIDHARNFAGETANRC